jgi:hypothetical protein
MIGIVLDGDMIAMLTFATAGAIILGALVVALVRAVRDQRRLERPPRERPLETPPPAPDDDGPAPPLHRE